MIDLNGGNKQVIHPVSLHARHSSFTGSASAGPDIVGGQGNACCVCILAYCNWQNPAMAITKIFEASLPCRSLTVQGQSVLACSIHSGFQTFQKGTRLQVQGG